MVARTHDRNLINVLLVEDSNTQALLAKLAMKAAGRLHLLARAADGVEALQYLRREGAFAGAQLPDVVLLDINMPRMNGLDVLRELKADAKLCVIPVVMLSTSEDENDIATAYECGANTYIVKPMEIVGLKNVFERLVGYWTKAARLPLLN